MDETPPTISFPISEFVNGSIPTPNIIDDSQVSVRYYLDDNEISFDSIANSITTGSHTIRIDAKDETGNTSTQLYSFIVDKTEPRIIVNTPKNNTVVSETLFLDFTILDDNPSDQIYVLLPNGIALQNQTFVTLDTSSLDDGQYQIVISATDKANNKNQKDVFFKIDRTKTTDNYITSSDAKFDYNFALLLIAGIFAIGIAIFIILTNKSQKLPKY